MNSSGRATARKMNPPTKKRQPQKAGTRKKTGSFNSARFISSLLLLLLLGFSLCAVGYVIFFRTVVAQEIPPDIVNGTSLKTASPAGGGKGLVTVNWPVGSDSSRE